MYIVNPAKGAHRQAEQWDGWVMETVYMDRKTEKHNMK